MSDLLRSLLTDLDAESGQLFGTVEEIGDDGWSLPTPAEGWTIATQIAHLVWTDEVATLAARSHESPDAKQAWDDVLTTAAADPYGFVDEGAHGLAGLTRHDVLERWTGARAGLRAALLDHPDGQRMPWFGPPMSPASMATARFMETWAHAIDVYDALGRRPRATDRIRPVAHLGVRTRDHAFTVNQEDPPAETFLVQLVAPSGETWTWGPPDAAQTVTGSAYDFCLLVTQRAHRDATDLVATGPDAEHWLTIAQAFAGPPGPGRAAS